MTPIRKTILKDSQQRPVAVQIEYADWLEIERRLHLEDSASAEKDLQGYAGTIALKEEPLEYQSRVRGEWP